MFLRSATIQDIDSIMKIEKESFIPEIQESKEVFEERIKTFSEGFVLFVDSETSEVFGYFSTERWNTIPKNESVDKLFSLGHSAKKSHCQTGSVLYITSFAILPNFRGTGCGKALFSEALSFILKNQSTLENPIENLLLMVNEQWKGAFHIYESYGFSTIKIIKGIFSNANAIVMQKKLK